ncbi:MULTISPECIES: FG-GAP repeat domain-containing protein [unclassified Agarivorans]|uniref:FG-GAP repeat domain-containing protein n=1 Tax=unclassified Agarivorans TaxID=2636026 RepID=UPI0026E39BCD|nr:MULTISPECIES: VCBS repeat-containing protein [unclassified Agarivorans]MDO6685896.1 VCBS repeat-containing protein [Agarivorans sp. 3_MG-2023]MDO6713966.1 VCBS repeat-containing protein [Agarivorans sp. 2_MG-2023]
MLTLKSLSKRCFTSALLLACWLPQTGYSLAFKQVATNADSIISSWHEQELKRQGGKFGSHGWWPWGVGGFDYDNDGDIDIYLSHHGQPGGKLLVNQLIPKGTLEFIALDNQLPGADDRPWFFDFDGDGWLDIAAFSDEKNNPYVINKATELTTGSEKQTFSPVSYAKTVSDLNGDGYLDLDAGSKGAFFYHAAKQQFIRDKTFRSNANHLLPEKFQHIEEEFRANNKANRFFRTKVSQHFLNRSPLPAPMLAPLDLNNDSLADIIVAGHGGYGGEHLGWYFLANQQNGFQLANDILKLPVKATPIFVGDLNGDQRQDIITTGKGEGDIYLASKYGFAQQKSALREMLNAGAPYLVRIFAVDFDNDRDLDLVVSNPRKKYGKVLENNGKGQFKEVLSFKGWDSNPIFIADINNDLRQDLIIGGASNKQLQVFLNTGEAQQNTVYLYPRYKSPNPYAVDAILTLFNGDEVIDQQRARWDGLPTVFSLGALTKASVEVTFSDGSTQRYQDIVANQSYSLMVDGEKYLGFVPAHLIAD